jgi:hypothetical protein
LTRIRAGFALIATAGLMLLAPGAAQAANTFVDDDRPDNSGDCLTPATACQTMSGLTGGVFKAGAGDTVWVDGGTYMESVTVNMGKSLREADFNTADMDTEAVIDGGAMSAVTTAVGPAGIISGFTLRSTGTAAHLIDPAQLTGNVLDSTADGSTGVLASGMGSTIGPGNVISDDDNFNDQRIGIQATNNTIVTGNDFSNLSLGVVAGDTTTLTGNEFTGTHQVMGGQGVAIITTGATSTPTIVGNHFHSPDPGSASSSGVFINNSASATLRRNRIFDHTVGVTANDSTAASLSSDVIANSNVAGLVANDTGGPGTGDVTATNVTFAGNAPTDIIVNDALLTLNSSIVEDPIVANGTATCAIDFSRGPSPMMGGTGCADFDTDAPPGFLGDGFHLSPFSALVDLGDPAAPVAPNDLDIDSQPLAADSNCDGIVRRNIGADEFTRGCTASPPPADAPGLPSQATKKKKCKRKKGKKCKRKRKKGQ